MHRIVKADLGDAEVLSQIGKVAWVDAHGTSAAPADIDHYVATNYAASALAVELQKPANHYHILYVDATPAGFSNVIFNTSDATMPASNLTELDRLYLLSDFRGRKLGLELLRFNLALAKRNAQAGIWLYVWKGNSRALAFYLKAGFVVVGSHDFQISESHSNPNHRMLLML